MVQKEANRTSDLEKRFLSFSMETHARGSNAASSYVKAIQILTECLKQHTTFLRPEETVWDIRSPKRLATLYSIVKEEYKKPDGGIFRDEPSKSYWKKNFCSAALKDFAKFLLLSNRQDDMLSKFDHATDGANLAKTLNKVNLPENPLLLDDNVPVSSAIGKTILREIKVRQNQNVFRKMVLRNYHLRCCLTGLPVVEVLRASHISAWADDMANRLNPENGLCLSATYDAAFDRHLISLDDDYRLILAPSLHDFYTNEAFKAQFRAMEGHSIEMPRKFFPSKMLLAKHREKMQ